MCVSECGKRDRRFRRSSNSDPPGAFTVVRQGSTIGSSLGAGWQHRWVDASGSLARRGTLTAPTLVNPEEIFRRRPSASARESAADPDTPDGETPSLPDRFRRVASIGVRPPSVETFKPDENSDPSEVRLYVAVGFSKRSRHG